MAFYIINHRAPLEQWTFIDQILITFLFCRQKLLLETTLARIRQT